MRHSYLVLSFLAALFILNGCSNAPNEFSEAISSFNDEFGHATSLYFYNSTLEMVNVNQDPSFHDLVKDIKKIRVITYKGKEELNREKFKDLTDKIHKESYVDMMQMNNNGFNILVFMQKRYGKPAKFIGIGYDLNNFYIVDLVGSIPVSKISSVINGNINFSGISSILNFTGPNNTKKQKHKNDNGDDPGNK